MYTWRLMGFPYTYFGAYAYTTKESGPLHIHLLALVRPPKQNTLDMVLQTMA